MAPGEMLRLLRDIKERPQVGADSLESFTKNGFLNLYLLTSPGILSDCELVNDLQRLCRVRSRVTNGGEPGHGS